MSSHCLSFLALISAFHFKFQHVSCSSLTYIPILTYPLSTPPPCNIHTHKQPSSDRSMRLPIVVMTAQDWRPSTTSWRRRQTSTTTSSARAWINSLDLDHPSKGKVYGQYMWQSRVEIEHYFVPYFNCITVFKALYHKTSVKGGAHMRWVNSWILTTFTQRVWVPPLTEVLR